MANVVLVGIDDHVVEPVEPVEQVVDARVVIGPVFATAVLLLVAVV